MSGRSGTSRAGGSEVADDGGFHHAIVAALLAFAARQAAMPPGPATDFTSSREAPIRSPSSPRCCSIRACPPNGRGSRRCCCGSGWVTWVRRGSRSRSPRCATPSRPSRS